MELLLGLDQPLEPSDDRTEHLVTVLLGEHLCVFEVSLHQGVLDHLFDRVNEPSRAVESSHDTHDGEVPGCLFGGDPREISINDLPEGMYTIQQLDPDCAVWNVRVDWMTN